MKYHVVVNEIDLGYTEVWQAPTELVEMALNAGKITQADVDGDHSITLIEEHPEPAVENVVAGSPDTLTEPQPRDPSLPL